MKKLSLFTMVILLAVNLFADTRTIYVTRHGQRGDLHYRKRFENCIDDTLMPNGQEQAKRLGLYMKSIGFNGTVYVSPYYRTLETATLALEGMDQTEMILEPRFQEVSGTRNTSGKISYTKECLTKKEIKENFPHTIIPKKIKFPWRIINESQNQTDERISKLFDDLLNKTSGDIFLVGHGGILASVVRVMNERGADFQSHKIYNCDLYSFTFDTETHQLVKSEDHTMNFLPVRLITDNLALILIPPVSNVED